MVDEAEQAITFTGIWVDEVDYWWPHALPHVHRGLMVTGEIERYQPKDILDEIKKKRLLLWTVNRGDTEKWGTIAVIMTRIMQYPHRRELLIYFAAGKDMHEWVAMAWEHLRRYARANGCKVIQIHRRKGWERVLKGEFEKTTSLVYRV